MEKWCKGWQLWLSHYYHQRKTIKLQMCKSDPLSPLSLPHPPAPSDIAAVETGHEGAEVTFHPDWAILTVAKPSGKNKVTDA